MARAVTINGSRPDWNAVHRVRLGHVRRLLRARYGTELPDDDAGAEDLRVLLHTKALCYDLERREQALRNEIELSAPWMAANKASTIAAEIAAKPMKLKPDTLGRMLNLDWRTREQLRVWQIGAVDLDADALKERQRLRRRKRDREATRRRRRKHGVVPRPEYLAKTKEPKPWQRFGVSKATWYRNGWNRKPPKFEPDAKAR